MPLVPGARLGPYEVIAPLGAGGMGEVYRARDTRLDRTVAIKVLPAPLVPDPDRRARFEREARAISSLNHPHICTLYDVGEQDGVVYLVMEYVDGQTLADRLEKGPLPVDQVLRHGIEIAGALDSAHRAGIVHRDLKPANVMLTKSGVKLLDFGLAKLRTDGVVAPGTLSALATAEKPLTGEGTLLGTLPYMAPEQVEGKEADARTDIWALAVVLYEMATGKPAFAGTSQASLIGAILKDEPEPIVTVQPLAPAGLDRLVRMCLAKDRDHRWQSAADVAEGLRWIAEPASLGTLATERVATARRRREVGPWAVAALLAVATIGLAVSRRIAPPAARPVRFTIAPPEGTAIGSFTEAGAVALSPDGTRVAFTTVSADGKRRLWVRDLDSVTARALPGADGASLPFWSPDGRSLGFFTTDTLKRIALAGGPSQTICTITAAGRGAAWNSDGVILFATETGPGLLRVAAGGGAVVDETALGPGELNHLWPSFLPDGQGYLFLVLGDEGRWHHVHVGSLGNRERRKLVPSESGALYAPPGYLLFFREGALMAQAFNARARQVTGEPVPVAEGVGRVGGAAPQGYSAFSASATGVLAYGRAPHVLNQLLWIDRGGTVRGSVGAPGDYADPALSADGRRLAVCRDDPQTATPDIWIVDLVRGNFSRFTFHPRWEVYPVWSPDGTRIAFSSDRTLPTQLYVKPTAGGAEERVLDTTHDAYPTDWSSDGRFLIYSGGRASATRNDIWTLPLDGERKPRPLLQSPFNEAEGQLSPDGRVLAFSSDESGRPEVYVGRMPTLTERWQVSTGGGRFPTWRRDGKELFYLAADRKLMAVGFATGSASEGSVPSALFQTRVPEADFPGFHSMYVPAADGQRFLVLTEPETFHSPPVTIVLNWSAGLT
jgi:Tol biopolymer transport system component/predicted Ser/Thr protein kinase